MPFITATVLLAAKSFWILDPLYTALGTVLAWFYDVIPSYGVAIILLTLAVRLLTFPLTAKQARSQQQLQKLQPELKRLQAKYKGDKQKLNEEMMKFYKENHVNPFGGCLPLFIQFPVLIVLYRLILGLTRTFIVGFAILVGAVVAVGGAPAGPLEGATVQGGHVSGGTLSKGVITDGTLEDAHAVVGGTVVGTVSDAKIVKGRISTAQVVKGSTTVGTMTNLTVTGGQLVGAPKNVPQSSSLYRALKTSGGKMVSWGMDLSKRASDVAGSQKIPFVILVLLVGATGFYQQRQLTGRLPKESANSQMAMMGKVFPIIFVFISWTIPAGVVVYFLVSNIWQIGQQAFMFRNQPRPEGGSPDAAKQKKGPTPTVGKGKARPSNAPKTAKGMTPGRPSKGAKGSKGTKVAGGSPGGGARRQGKAAPNNGAKRGPSRAAQAPKGRTPRSGQAPRPGNRSTPKKPVPNPKSTRSPETSTSREISGENADSKPPKSTDAGRHKGGPPGGVEEDPTTTDTPGQGAARGAAPAPAPLPGSNGSAPLAMPLPPAAGDQDKDSE